MMHTPLVFWGCGHYHHVKCWSLPMERNSQKIIARLKREGFELISVKGSHHKFRKGSRTIIVPHPKKDLPMGTASAIAKQAGWI